MPRLSANLLPTTTVASVVVATALISGTKYRIVTIGTTDFTLVGASENTIGIVFTATSVGAGTGTASEEIDGIKVKGDGYFGFNDGLHTIAYYLTAFEGTLEIQVALTDDPVDSDWITLDTRIGTSGTPLTENVTYNFTGNFVWVRAKVTNFEQGTITKIQLNH